MIPFCILYLLCYTALTVAGAKCPERCKKLFFRIELILSAAGLALGLLTTFTFGLFPFRRRPEPEFLSWAKDNFFHFSKVTWIMCAAMLFFILLPILVSIVEKRPASGYPVVLRYVAPVICSAILRSISDASGLLVAGMGSLHSTTQSTSRMLMWSFSVP